MRAFRGSGGKGLKSTMRVLGPQEGFISKCAAIQAACAAPLVCNTDGMWVLRSEAPWTLMPAARRCGSWLRDVTRIQGQERHRSASRQQHIFK